MVVDRTTDDEVSPVEMSCCWVVLMVVADPGGSAVGDHDFLVLINMYHLPVDFRLPSPGNNYRWVRLIDTAAWAETNYNCWSVEQGAVIADRYKVNGFSIVVLEEIN